MGLSKKDVLHVAHLGRIHLSDADVAKFATFANKLADTQNLEISRKWEAFQQQQVQFTSRRCA